MVCMANESNMDFVAFILVRGHDWFMEGNGIQSFLYFSCYTYNEFYYRTNYLANWTF